jgi:hypothetical protein
VLPADDEHQVREAECFRQMTRADLDQPARKSGVRVGLSDSSVAFKKNLEAFQEKS